MDRAGAVGVVANDIQLGRLLAGAVEAGLLAKRLLDLAGSRSCLGCATCCRTSSPTLYAEDGDLVQEGGLPREGLFALRQGQKAYSARVKRRQVLSGELIKVRERAQGGCLFLEGNRCRIYQSRPLQCRHLECWSGSHAGQLQDRPRLSRKDLFCSDQTALDLIAEYEAKIPAAELEKTLEAAAQGQKDQQAQALSWLELDLRLRQGVAERYGYAGPELELLWGLSAVELARIYGLELEVDGAGRPALGIKAHSPRM
jgi:Fe-S-cluster containining protein